MWPNDIFNMCKWIYIELCGQVYMLRMEKQSEIHRFNQNVYHIYIICVCNCANILLSLLLLLLLL